MRVDKAFAEHDAGHLDGVLRPLRGGDGSHERLVTQAQVRVDHVEVALVHRPVYRLAYRAACVVQPRRRAGQLDEVLEVGQRAVASASVHVVHEGRTVSRRENDVVLSDEHRALPVAGVLDEAPRRRLGDDRLEVSRLETHAFSPHVGARLAPERDCVRVAAKLDPDLLEDSIGGPVDEVQSFLVQQAVGRDAAPHTRDRGRICGGALPAAGAGARTAPGTAGRCGGGGTCHARCVMPGRALAGPEFDMDKASRESDSGTKPLKRALARASHAAPIRYRMGYRAPPLPRAPARCAWRRGFRAPPSRWRRHGPSSFPGGKPVPR